MGARAAGSGPQQNTPQVSVVIPTRDRWDVLLRRALRAALSQRRVPVEVIVVDDCSNQPPPAAPRLSDPRVTVIKQNAHRGVAAARNLGIDAARTGWVAFLDDDDVWAPSKLNTIIESIMRSGAEFGYSSALAVDDDLLPLWEIDAPPTDQLLDWLLRCNVMPAGASNVVAKRSILERCGGFDEDFSVVADWDMWLRLAEHGSPAQTNEVLIAYSIGNWVLRDDAVHRAEFSRLVEKHASVADSRGVPADWVAHERWIARNLYLAGRRAEAARLYLASGFRYRDPGSLARAAGALVGPEVRARLRVGQKATPSQAPEWLRPYADGVPAG